MKKYGSVCLINPLIPVYVIKIVVEDFSPLLFISLLT